MANWQNIPQGWQVAYLGDVLSSLQNGLYKPAEFYGRGQPFVRMYNVDSQSWNLTLDTLARVEVDSKEQALFGLQESDVLISRVNSIEMLGKTAWVNRSAQGHVYENMLMRLRFQENVEPLFIAQQLNTPELRAQVRSCAKKASGQASINSTDVQGLEIILPPLSEQRRIAAVLARADRLRRLRRYALDLSAGYLQAVFVEMFGSSLTNPRGWPLEEMGTYIGSIRYGTGSPPGYVEHGLPFIRATNIKEGRVLLEYLAHISKEGAASIRKCQVKAGNMIIVRSGANTGDSALVPPELDGAYAAYDLIVELPFPQNWYFNQLINSEHGKSVIKPLSRRAGQPHLNSEQVQSLRFIDPPLPLQERFAAIAQRHERLRGQQREALRQAEQLFGALLGQAFRGELSS